MSIQIVFLSFSISLNLFASKCSPILVTSKVESSSPSATILSLIFMVNFKKDLLKCSRAIFNLISFKGNISLTDILNLSKFSLGTDS